MMSDKSLQVTLRGRALLDSPYYNKGTAFTESERATFGLEGLLPANVQTLDQQHKRAYEQYQKRGDMLSKNVFMTSMAEQNTVLFFKLLLSHIKEMFPVVYTPTEGTAIENYSHLFRRPNGCFLDITQQHQVEERLRTAAGGRDIQYIVVSDGEAILGLGDQGVGGILISAAKLIIATACGGVNPHRTLPVVLDVGTDNDKLEQYELYLGTKKRRARGKEYDQFVDKFVQSARKTFPDAYIHFEDFGVTNARKILDRYRDQFACFNDDIQGTGCVVFAAINAALHVTKTPLKDLRVLVYGAGSAGCGIAQQIVNGIAAEYECDAKEIYPQITCVDKQGVLISSMSDTLNLAQQPFARPSSSWPQGSEENTTDLTTIISHIKPHVLIGTSTRAGAFTESAVREMHKHVDRPIILPLSNPTSLHEAVPEDLIHWTDGKALIATGSPFDPVEYKGTTYEVGECNNSVCFPGIGLGCILSKASRLTDAMLLAGVKGMASMAPILVDEKLPLVPDVEVARSVSLAIAAGVIAQAKKDGVCQEEGVPEIADGDADGHEMEDLKRWIEDRMWRAEYPEFAKA